MSTKQYKEHETIKLDKCPICKKEFVHNSQSIYKLSRGQRVRHYCSYTCWRKAGGDGGKPKHR